MLSVAIIAQTNTARTHISEWILATYWSRLSAVFPAWSRRQGRQARLPSLYIASCGIHHTQPVHALTRRLLEESRLFHEDTKSAENTESHENVFHANVLSTMSNRALFTLTRSIDYVVHIDDTVNTAGFEFEESPANNAEIDHPTVPAHWKTPCPKLQYCAQWYTISPQPRPQRSTRVRGEADIYGARPHHRSTKHTPLPWGVVPNRQLQDKIEREPEPVRRRRFQDEYQGEPMYLEYVPLAAHAREQQLNSPALRIAAGPNSNTRLDPQSAYERLPYSLKIDELNQDNLILRERRLKNTQSGLNPTRRGPRAIDGNLKIPMMQGSKVLLARRPARVEMPKIAASDLQPIRHSARAMPGMANVHSIVGIPPVSDDSVAESEAEQYARFRQARDALALEMQKVVVRLLGSIGVLHAGQLRDAASAESPKDSADLCVLLRNVFALQGIGQTSDAAKGNGETLPESTESKQRTLRKPMPTIFDASDAVIGSLADEMGVIYPKESSLSDGNEVDLLADDAL